MSLNSVFPASSPMFSERQPFLSSNGEAVSDELEVIEQDELDQLNGFGIQAFRANPFPGATAGLSILGAASGSGSASICGSAYCFGAPMLALYSPICCALSAIFFTAAALPKAVSEYYWSKVERAFNLRGKVRNLVDQEGFSILYSAVVVSKKMKRFEKSAEGSEELEKSGTAWCEYLIDNGASLDSSSVEKSPLFAAVSLNELALARLFERKGANIDLLVDTWAPFLKYSLKKERADLEAWYAFIPRLKKQGILQNRIRVFSHMLDVNLNFNGFEGAGWNSWDACSKFKKLYVAMTTDEFKGTHSSATQKLLIDSLNVLIEEEDLYAKIGDLKTPLLIDVGYCQDGEKEAHTNYLWVFGEIFVYADTGTHTCSRLFNTDKPAVVGRIDREKLTHEMMALLLSLRDMKGSEHFNKLKEICEILGLAVEATGFPAPVQRVGSCSWTALVACMAAVASISTSILAVDEDKNYDPLASFKSVSEALPSSQARFFRDLMPLYYVNNSKLLSDPDFCSNPAILPVLTSMRDRFAKSDFVLHIKRLVHLLSRNEEERQAIIALRRKAVVRLSKIIRDFDLKHGRKKLHE